MPRESFDVSLLPQHTSTYCVSGNGNTMVGHRGDDSYHVFAGPHWHPQGVFTGTQTDMALSPDGRTLAAVENHKLIRLFSIATGRELMTLDSHLHGCHDICFSPDGQRLLAAGQGLRDRGEIVVWDTADGPSKRVSAR